MGYSTAHSDLDFTRHDVSGERLILAIGAAGIILVLAIGHITPQVLMDLEPTRVRYAVRGWRPEASGRPQGGAMRTGTSGFHGSSGGFHSAGGGGFHGGGGGFHGGGGGGFHGGGGHR